MIPSQLIRKYIRYLLAEGGLKAPELTAATRLSPTMVQQVTVEYKKIIEDWNEYLQARGKDPVLALEPVGSSKYYLEDIDEKKEDVVYGDVDYLVEFPFPSLDAGDTERHKLQLRLAREYETYLVEWLAISPPASVDVEATLKSSPTLLIVKLPGGEYVQVDMIVTWPKYSEWARARYTPQRGVKGYTLGNLYTALGQVLVLTVGQEGVVTRTQHGKRVSGRVRKDVVIKNVSTDPLNFLLHIAHELGGEDIELDSELKKFPGVDPDNVKISYVAHGINGLFNTLLDAGIIDQGTKELFLQKFRSNLEANVRKKEKRGLPSQNVEKLLKLNGKVYDVVSSLITQ